MSRSGPARTEAVGSALGRAEVSRFYRLGLQVRHDHELGDSISWLDPKYLRRIRVQQEHAYLTAVTGVDESRRVDQ